MSPKSSNDTFRGHSLKTLVLVGTACSAVSSIFTLFVDSGRAVTIAQAKADAHIEKIVESTVSAADRDIVGKLEEHTKAAEAAMAPGGIMHRKFDKVERRVEWLVKDRVCHIDHRSPCPSLGDVFNGE